MKGDFSRSTFRRKQHYHSVRMQQGRVLLDAEANEQGDIQSHLRETTARDIIGRTGAPRDHAGFRIHWTGSDLLIGAGRFYVDGILCENEGFTSAVQSMSGNALVLKSFAPELAANIVVQLDGTDKTTGGLRTEFLPIATATASTSTITFASLANFAAVHFVRSTIRFADQPDLARPQFLNTTTRNVNAGDYIVYLDVWQRHITALDDPLIRETALGIPDTASRAKTVWQVVLQQPVVDCKAFRIDPPTGTMAAQAVPPSGPQKPCEIPSSAGYRRLENQLYRVEIHAGGTANAATFKWSRDNGSIVYAVDTIIGTDQIRLKSTALDDRLALHQNEWVELTDDAIELLVKPPNAPVQISNPPQGGDPVVRVNANIAGTIDLTRNPRLRVWADPDAAKAARGLAEGANAGGFVALEDGIEVKFSSPGTYNTGDYWLIPARTAISQETGTIEWPMSGTTPQPLPPHGIVHHFAPLAELRSGAIEDCRPIFSPESAPNLYYDGGDGQQVPTITGAGPVALPSELRAGVSNGRAVPGAIVQFAITSPNGGNLVFTPPSGPAVQGTTINVPTNAQGIAACRWFANLTDLDQTVIATLIDTDLPGFVAGLPPIQYTARIETASQVRYQPGACPDLTVTTVQEAIDVLCKKPSGGGICIIVISEGDNVAARFNEIPAAQQDMEVCFRTGKFAMSSIAVTKKNSVTITGTGAGSLLDVDTWNAFLFDSCANVVIRDLSIRTGSKEFPLSPVGSLHFRNCGEIILDNVHVTTSTNSKNDACVTVGDGARSLNVERCVLHPGQGMIGVLASNPQFVTIERNIIGGVSTAQPAIDRFRTQLTPNIKFGDQAGTGPTSPRLNVGTVPVSFDIPDPATFNEWQVVVQLMTDVSANVRTAEDAQRFFDEAIVRLSSDATIRGRAARLAAAIPAGSINPFAGRADAAIVLRGQNIGSAVICENDIDFVLGGVRAGSLEAKDVTRRVVMERNDVSLFSEVSNPDAPGPRGIGLSVASAGSILLGGNRIASNTGKGNNDGIRINGELGQFVVIRDNHISSVARGIEAIAQGATPAGPPRQWRIVSNFAGSINAPLFALENNV